MCGCSQHSSGVLGRHQLATRIAFKLFIDFNYLILLVPLQAAGQQQEVKEQGSDPLAELAVDCTADPEACAAVVEGSNSYYASNPADEFDVAAEAAAYLQAVHAPNTWNAVIGATQKLGGEAPNTYEGVEDQWVQKRVAEEAGSQYLDASALDLDCSVVAGSANALECERTKAVNRYEAAPPTVQVSALTLQCITSHSTSLLVEMQCPHRIGPVVRI